MSGLSTQISSLNLLLLIVLAVETMFSLAITIYAIFGLGLFGRLQGEGGLTVEYHMISLLVLSWPCIVITWVIGIREWSRLQYAKWYHHRHVLPRRMRRTREEVERVMLLDVAEGHEVVLL
jgi:hypothetical protein